MKKRTKEQKGCHVDKWELENLVRKHFESEGRVVESVEADYEAAYDDDDPDYFTGFNVKFRD